MTNSTEEIEKMTAMVKQMVDLKQQEYIDAHLNLIEVEGEAEAAVSLFSDRQEFYYGDEDSQYGPINEITKNEAMYRARRSVAGTLNKIMVEGTGLSADEYRAIIHERNQYPY